MPVTSCTPIPMSWGSRSTRLPGVASAAAGGQIVVSSVVKELVGSDPEFRFGAPIFAELRRIEGVNELGPSSGVRVAMTPARPSRSRSPIGETLTARSVPGIVLTPH